MAFEMAQNESELLQTISSNAATTDLVIQPLHHSRETCLGVKRMASLLMCVATQRGATTSV